ncbi:MAG: hypothetical protein N2560_08070 [Ignavibacteria bacterium]|nr:hypothetical protein [Ignavibacteria bacterium]
MKKIKPKRIFEELAEMGVLDDLLRNQWKRFYEQNEKFREDINEILLTHSKERATVLEKYYLEQLCESLQFFIDYTKQWKNPKQ